MKLTERMENLPSKYQNFPIREYKDLTPEEKELAATIIVKFINRMAKEEIVQEGAKLHKYTRKSPYVLEYLQDTRWRWTKDEYDDEWVFEWTTGYYFDT